MTIKEIEERMAQISEEMNLEGADIRALSDEVDSLIEQRNAIENLEADRKALAARVLQNGQQKKDFKEGDQRTMEYTNESKEYRTGFLKTLLGQELTEEERSAVSFVATTTDETYGSGNVLPATMLNEIWDLIEEEHSILGDIKMYRTGTILEVNKRTAINQGDAKSVNEATANDDEINTFVKVTLAGKDFSKHIDISYAMANMSIEAFEQFLRDEIAARLGAALAADVIAQILADYDDANNAIETASVGVTAFSDIAATFAVIENAKSKVVYANNSTIYSQLVGMVDDNGRPIFQLNANEGVEGALIGAPVKVEDAIEDDVILIGDPQKVVYNMVTDIMLETARDIKKHVITYSGYARGEGALLAPKAFATLTVQEED